MIIPGDNTIADAIANLRDTAPSGESLSVNDQYVQLIVSIATENGGRCHLRFDDTNPVKEEREYFDAIKRDIRWLGFEWGEREYHASDYFEQLYDWARQLIRDG